MPERGVGTFVEMHPPNKLSPCPHALSGVQILPLTTQGCAALALG